MAELPVKGIAKGLATIALLKTNYDLGQDHIGMFIPFVLDSMLAIPADNFTLEEVRSALSQKHGLTVPSHTLQTLLSRACRQGCIRRDAGRFFKISGKLPKNDLAREQNTLLREHKSLAQRFQAFAASQKIILATEDDALALVWDFFDANHVAMLLDTEPIDSMVGYSKIHHKAHMRIAAAFLSEALRTQPETTSVIGRMLEGYVLQNTLLLRDITSATRRFRNLAVFIDTGIITAAFGYKGEATQRATLEAFVLLRETGARLAVFDATLAEVRRILLVYEEHLKTDQGRKSLYPYDMTRYFLTKHYGPSDIRTQIALIEQNARNLGLSVQSLPSRIPKYTLGEAQLTQMIGRTDAPFLERRVKHDVDCVAAVLTLRHGATYTSLDDACAVFLSGTGLLVRNTLKWYRDQEGLGIPPIVHELALSNAAWLKCPAAAPNLKLTQLVALCGAALRPTRKVWSIFLRHLNDLEKSGVLSSDEATAVVASEFTDRVLAEVESEGGADWEPDAETLTEVIERVRALYKDESAAQVAIAQRAQRTSEERITALHGRLFFLAQQTGRSVAWVLFGVITAVLLAGLVYSLKDVILGQAARLTTVQLSVVILSALFGVLSTLLGFNALGTRLWVAHLITHLVARLLTGPRNGESQPSAEGDSSTRTDADLGTPQ